MKAMAIARKTTNHRASSYAISRLFIPLRLLDMAGKRIANSIGSRASDIFVARCLRVVRGAEILATALGRLVNKPMEQPRY